MEPKPKIPSYKKQTRADRAAKADNIWVEVKAWIPKKTADMIAEVSRTKQIPKSRVAAFMIDNAMSVLSEPFDMNIPVKPTTNVENEYAHEAKLIYEFLKKATQGLGLDCLLMFRRDIGITSKERLVGGYYELLNAHMIEEHYPYRHSFDFHPSYKVATIIKRRVKE
jgi:hypothetical protein